MVKRKTGTFQFKPTKSAESNDQNTRNVTPRVARKLTTTLAIKYSETITLRTMTTKIKNITTGTSIWIRRKSLRVTSFKSRKLAVGPTKSSCESCNFPESSVRTARSKHA